MVEGVVTVWLAFRLVHINRNFFSIGFFVVVWVPRPNKCSVYPICEWEYDFSKCINILFVVNCIYTY